ncbi:MAG: serine hydrolase [Alphaproteobacteria bacterium]
MRKLFAFLSVFLFCATAYAAGYRAALVADMDTGRVLYSENANVANYPASLTKIMTLYLTFDALEHGRLHLDDYLIVSNSAANAEPVKLGLSAGSKISVEDAIKAVAVHSANDVARVLAENLQGGKEGNFADLMTRVAREIGLKNTNFENSSGLPNDDHLSTARDIALLSVAVYKHFPQYWKYFGIKTWTFGGKTYTNGNRLLGTYPGCDGMKTGFTNKSKYSLVATAKRGNTHLITVVLGANDKDIRASTATNMLNRGFNIVGENAPADVAPVPVVESYPITQNNPMAKYATDKPQPVVQSGGAGVQFGAFSSYDAAMRQVQNVKNATGVNASVSQAPNGLYRVRVSGLSESSAQSIKNSASANGIDCYVFH